MPHDTLFEGSLPLYFRCLSTPVEWRRVMRRRAPYANALRARLETTPPAMEPDGDLLEVEPMSGKATTFDAWEKETNFCDSNEAILRRS